MTKHKLPRMRISVRIWMVILSIVVVVIGLIWVFQVMFLEDYYLRYKQHDFQKILTSVTSQVNRFGIVHAQNSLVDTVMKNQLCIDIIDDNDTGVKIEGMPYNCYVHKDPRREKFYLSLGRQIRSAKEEYVRTQGGKNRDYLVGVSRGRLPNGTGYVIIMTQGLASVKEASYVIRRQLMLISPVFIGLATVLAFWVAHSLTRPIRNLSEAARKIAGGDLDVCVSVKSNDELGDLARDFNYMSKELSKVNALQRELIANISHDIRTPLTMIKGYAEMMKELTGDDKEKRDQQLGIIIEESDHLNALANDALDLSLLQAGRIPLHKVVFSITEKCRSILKWYHFYEQTRGIELILDAPEEFLVCADEVRIERVIYNLLNNAINHLNGGKRITIHIHADGEREVKVEVEDTGLGIAKEDLPLIWERYYKPYKKGKKAMGTGLGLSIVKAALLAHESRFGVESTVNVGSTFWFTLKLATKEDMEDDEAPALLEKNKNKS